MFSQIRWPACSSGSRCRTAYAADRARLRGSCPKRRRARKRDAVSERKRSGSVKHGMQRFMPCRCGRERVLANALCATCYTLKRQDEEYFGGLREVVLERDGYCCRVCGTSGRHKRSITVHRRVPGKSVLHLMISLCPAAMPRCMNQDGPDATSTAASGAMARAAPGRP